MKKELVGSMVMCIDDANVTRWITKGNVYFVEDVVHNGKLLHLEGIEAPLASNRFQIFQVSESPTKE